MNSLRLAARRHLAASSRRFASTSTENAQKKAQEAAKDAQAKAQEYLAKASAASGPALDAGKKALDAGVKAMGPLGERVGNMLGKYKQPLLYNAAVGREFLKQVYITERLQPPTSWATVQGAYRQLWANASSPTYWRTVLSNGEWARLGIYAVEAYGIFKIGEIVGRRSLVGYNLH